MPLDGVRDLANVGCWTRARPSVLTNYVQISHSLTTRGVTQNIVGTHACPPKKTSKRGLFSDLKRRRRLWEKGLIFSLTFDFFFKEKGLLLSCPTPFRGRFYIFYVIYRGRFRHQGLRHLGPILRCSDEHGYHFSLRVTPQGLTLTPWRLRTNISVLVLPWSA